MMRLAVCVTFLLTVLFLSSFSFLGAYASSSIGSVNEIADKLSETEIDLSTDVASWVQLADTNSNRFDEVIRITDGNGHSYMCYFVKSSEKGQE